MLGEPLASRYEPSDSVTEDKYGRHTTGRRIEDGKPVVLSVLDPQLKAGVPEVVAVAEVSKRLAEARLWSILHCLEAGRTDGGNLYLVFEAAGHDSLKALVRARNGLPLDAALSVAWGIASVLKAAFDRGIFHLDLSSSNIFVDPETLRVRVARYGFSRLLPGYAPARRNEPFHGTAEYLAPEVCSGRTGDASADLYALGILMYEMVAGKPPFVSSSPSTTIKRQVYEKPLPLHVARPGIPGIEGYERLIARLLAKDPRGRPADPAEVLAEMETLRASLLPGTEFPQEPPREAPVEVACSLQAEVEREPAPILGVRQPESRETRVFTGLATEVAQAAAAPAPAPAPAELGVEGSRPTEAFDPSLVEAALREEAAQRISAPAEEPSQAAEVPAPAEPVATSAAGAEALATAGPADSVEAARKAAEWFVEGSQPLPESAFPPEEEERKESRMFWVIVGAVAILLVVGAVVYFEGAKPPPPEPSPPVVVAPPRPVPPPPPAPGLPAAIPDPGPAVVVTPDPGPPPEPPPPPPPPPEASPEEVKARQVADLLATGRRAFEAGNLDEARKAVESALALDRRNAEGQALLADIRKAARAAEPRRPRPPAPPRPAPDNIGLKKTPPAPPPAPPAPPPPPDEEAQAKIKQHIRAGRDAYNRGDYDKAIQAYSQALQLDPNNALVKKLLDQARAKTNP